MERLAELEAIVSYPHCRAELDRLQEFLLKLFETGEATMGYMGEWYKLTATKKEE